MNKDNYLNNLYKNRFTKSSDKEEIQRIKMWKVLCKHFFQKFISKNATVCDVAAGYCEFINLIEAKEKIAIDLNPSVKEYANSNITIVNDNVFNIDRHVKKDSVDVFFMSNFLEHLNSSDEVILLVKKLSEILKMGGVIIILQPNIRLVKGAYWDFIDHKVPLTEKSLKEVAEYCNLEVDTCITRFLPYTTKSSLPKNSFLVWLYLKLMPLSSFFLGKQSFLVLKKVNK